MAQREGEGKKAPIAGGYAQGLVLKAKARSANIMDRDGIKLLLERLAGHFVEGSLTCG